MYHTLFLGVMCIYFYLYRGTRKCQNSELASHSTVHNPHTKSLSGKNSFIPIKYKYLPSFWDQVEVDTTIFRILGNKWKKEIFPTGTPVREKISDSKFFFFVIIFTPFSVERYIKFYIWKCSQFDVEYDKKQFNHVPLFTSDAGRYKKSHDRKFLRAVKYNST